MANKPYLESYTDGEFSVKFASEGLTVQAKEALLNCFAHVAWTDEHGQDYYDALAEALGYTPEPTVKTLESISATKTKTSYEVGETFSTSDVVVTAHYSDGTTDVVTSGATIGTVDTTTSGSKSLEISYSEGGVTKTTTIAITVVSSEYPRGQISLTLIDGKRLYHTTGTIGNGSNYAADESYHDLKSGMTYTITGVESSGHSVSVAYYSENAENSFISYEQSIAQSSKVLTIPEGANYLRIGCYTSADINSVTLTES